MNRSIPSKILNRLTSCGDNLKQAKANVQGRLDTLASLNTSPIPSIRLVDGARRWLRVDNEILALSQKHYDRALSRYNEAAG